MAKKKTKTELNKFSEFGTAFRVLIPCRNDDTGNQYAINDTVSVEQFPPDVIENWLDIGVLEPREVE